VGDIRLAMRRTQERIGRKTHVAVRAAGNVLEDGTAELCPQDTSALYESLVNRYTGNGFDTVVIVGYARTDGPRKQQVSRRTGRVEDRWPPEYAVFVHEVTSASMGAQGGTWKFLEIPMHTERQRMQQASYEATVGIR